jgi:hypothetical protein
MLFRVCGLESQTSNPVIVAGQRQSMNELVLASGKRTCKYELTSHRLRLIPSTRR